MVTTAKPADRELDVDQIDAGRDVVKVRILRWKGREYLDVRRWYRGDDDELLPGKGLRCSAELIGPLRTALVAAEDALEDL